MSAPNGQRESGRESPDTGAGQDLTGSLYADLHEVAGNLMKRERPGCSLQPTILAHDAYLTLARQRNLRGCNRAALLAAATTIMRRLLVDSARMRRRLKRGAGKIENSLPALLTDDANTSDALEIHEAVDALRRHCKTTARIVELRFFHGMTHAEIAEVTGLCQRTVGEKWRFAKAWLQRAMNPGRQENCDDRHQLRTASNRLSHGRT
jgi:RNA polymerase sigma factor (TIGR02999 family)